MSLTSRPIGLEGAFVNLPEHELVRHCLERDGCRPTASGAVVAYSGRYTGRTPKDKYVVRDPLTDPETWWESNNPLTPESFDALRERVAQYLHGKPTYVVDAFAGADPDYRIAVRFILERAYHALFIRQLLIRPTAQELADFEPDWTVTDAALLSLDPRVEGIHGDTAIVLDLTRREVLIVGTQYAGEIKKTVFTIMNYLLPRQGVMSMHCSANIGPRGDTALFFGLSGTGKTSLSADPERFLIGDDEHGWSDRGVFNIEGGCYAKCIGLRRESEPEIWDALSFGTVLENVVLGPNGVPDYHDRSITENTRAAYPLDHVSNAVHPSVGGHPNNIFFLTCDALGLLPPISRLSPDLVTNYFLNGYTAKVAGTEAGITEPTVAFSACFGKPFLPLPPKIYVDLLVERTRRHMATVWLLNTGWTDGPYGTGHRIPIQFTRAMLRAALEGKLADVPFRRHPVFGVDVPGSCPEVPTEILEPRSTWPDPEAYDRRAEDLQRTFEANAKKMAGGVS